MNKSKIKRVINMLNCFINNRHRNVLAILDSGTMNVTEIQVEYFRRHNKGLSQPVFSVILADFRRYDLVNMEKDGKFHYYSINREKIERIRGWIDKLNRETK